MFLVLGIGILGFYITYLISGSAPPVVIHHHGQWPFLLPRQAMDSYRGIIAHITSMSNAYCQPSV